ncbi:galactosyl transferase GMA12/MNN10 family-domain-containing protein [Xylogone sp. PMI_703]|nr:galactosyl transferase GMA12/MNN10 family-domain-containing protein [Xylogone sp. PMI_703]
MHMALPARKTSHPPPYAARSSRLPKLRRSRLQAILIFAFVVGVIFFFLSHVSGGSSSTLGGPVVIVTVLDPNNYSQEYIKNIQENRIAYAKKHGYLTFFPTVTDYDLKGAPSSWTKVPAVRHAMTKFPHSSHIWCLDQNALIMNPSLSIENHIVNPKRLEELMVKNAPIVPPDSVIKTFSHLKGDRIDFILTQDFEGLSPSSFIIRSGDWAKFFLDAWFDPLYRSYNFQRAERHALEHIVQWHPTILSKLALVPQRIMNSYSAVRTEDKQGPWQDGDFVITFAGCEQRDCASESEPFHKQWRLTFGQD